MSKKIIFDFETSGLYASGNYNQDGELSINAPLELSIIYLKNDKIIEEFTQKIRPFDGAVIDEQALAVNGFTREEIFEFPSQEIAFENLLKFLDKHINRYDNNDKAIWIGHNVNFDIDFLMSWAKRNDFSFMGSYISWSEIVCTRHLLSTLNALGKIPNGEKLKSASLKSACEFFGINNSKAHTSLSDVRATGNLYYKLRSFIK